MLSHRETYTLTHTKITYVPIRCRVGLCVPDSHCSAQAPVTFTVSIRNDADSLQQLNVLGRWVDLSGWWFIFFGLPSSFYHSLLVCHPLTQGNHKFISVSLCHVSAREMFVSLFALDSMRAVAGNSHHHRGRWCSQFIIQSCHMHRLASNYTSCLDPEAIERACCHVPNLLDLHSVGTRFRLPVLVTEVALILLSFATNIGNVLLHGPLLLPYTPYSMIVFPSHISNVEICRRRIAILVMLICCAGNNKR
jgi:hypothetical protein